MWSTPAPTEAVAGGSDSAELGDGELAGAARAGLGRRRGRQVRRRLLGALGWIRPRRRVALEGLDPGDEDVDDAFATLEAAAGADHHSGADGGPVAFVDALGNDHVDDPVLVFQGHEDDPFGGPGALGGGEHAADLDPAAAAAP